MQAVRIEKRLAGCVSIGKWRLPDGRSCREVLYTVRTNANLEHYVTNCCTYTRPRGKSLAHTTSWLCMPRSGRTALASTQPAPTC